MVVVRRNTGKTQKVNPQLKKARWVDVWLIYKAMGVLLVMLGESQNFKLLSAPVTVQAGLCHTCYETLIVGFLKP